MCDVLGAAGAGGREGQLLSQAGLCACPSWAVLSSPRASLAEAQGLDLPGGEARAGQSHRALDELPAVSFRAPRSKAGTDAVRLLPSSGCDQEILRLPQRPVPNSGLPEMTSGRGARG